jgi:hypothetical protein
MRKLGITDAKTMRIAVLQEIPGEGRLPVLGDQRPRCIGQDLR